MSAKLFTPALARKLAGLVLALVTSTSLSADEALPVVAVEGQPLAANVRRVIQALDLVGQPLAAADRTALEAAAQDRDHARLQTLLDKHVLLVVAINPESRVKVARGPA